MDTASLNCQQIDNRGAVRKARSHSFYPLTTYNRSDDNAQPETEGESRKSHARIQGRKTQKRFRPQIGGLADVERDLIRTRTAEGRSRAKAHGRAMGRPPSLPGPPKEAIRRRAQGATLDQLARSYNVSRATISRLANLVLGTDAKTKGIDAGP